MTEQTAIIEKTSFQVDSDNPYLGLASFEEAHQEFFFGRDDEIQSLQRLVRRDVLTVLFGVSGLGKTSLLQAGLFPLLRQQNALPVWIRLSYDPQAPHPETQIKQMMAQAVQLHCLDTPPPESDETLWEYFHRVPFWSRRNRLLTPVLVFDQFEELFTLGRGISENRDFLQQLANLAENQVPESVSKRLHNSEEDLPYDYGQPAVKIILSLREDYLAQLEDLRRYIPSLSRNRYRLLPMNGEQALQAVKSPAESLVDETVAENIVRFVAGKDQKLSVTTEAPELDQLKIEPALLSLVSRELNQRRLNSGEDSISAELLALSRDQILTDFYQRSLKDLNNGVQCFIEDELLTASGYRSTKAQEDALQIQGVSEDALLSLVDRRLLRLEERLGMPHLELIHDVMAPVVKQCREERRREENLRKTKLQLLIGGSAVIAVLVAFSAFVWIMYGWWQEAEQAKKTANVQLARNYMRQGVTNRDVDKDLLKASYYFYQAGKYAELSDSKGFSDNAIIAADTTITKLPTQFFIFQNKAEVLGAVFSTDERRVLSWSDDGTVRVWDIASGEVVTLVHEKRVNGAVFSTDERRVLTWSVKSYKKLAWLRYDRSYLSKSVVRVWDVDSGEAVTLAHEESVKGAVFSTDERRVLSWSDDGTARVWDIASGEAVTMAHEDWLNGAVFSTDQRRVLTWSGNLYKKLQGLRSGLGRSFISKSVVRVWDVASGEAVTLVNKNWINGAVFSTDQRRVLTWSVDRTARVWDIASGEAVTLAHEDWLNGAVFSTDQRRVLTWSGNLYKKLQGLRSGLGRSFISKSVVRVWDVASGEAVTLVNKNWINGAVFSTDQRRVLTRSNDGTARVWDSDSGKAVSAPMLHKDSVNGAEFSADQRRVLTWSADGTARVWDSDSGEAVTAPMVHKKQVNGAEFSVDQRKVLTWSADGTAQVWDLSADLDFPKRHLGLQFEVRTWKKLNEVGDTQELFVEDWQKKWNEYEPIAINHLKHCQFPHANWYIERMIQSYGSCESPGEWLQKVNKKILPEVKKLYSNFCLERGNQLLYGEYFDQAKRSIITALELHPESAKAYDRLGWNLIKSGENPAKGIEYAKKSLQLNSYQQPSYALNTLAAGYAETGQNALASATFLKLARAHKRWQQYQQAMDAYNRVLKLPAVKEAQVELEEYKKNLELLIKSFDKKKDARKIAQYYEQALQSGFNDSLVLANWSNTLARTLIDHDIDISKGVDYAKQSVELDPNEQVVDTLALGYIKQQKFNQAIDLLKQSLQKHQGSRELTRRLKEAEREKKAALISQ